MIKATILIAAILTATAAHARPREFSIGLAEQQTKGLVAYYPMIVSGTTVTDRSGNGNDGTAINAPTFSYANGYVGDGVSLDGTTQYISLPHPPPWLSDTKGAISATFRITTLPTSDAARKVFNSGSTADFRMVSVGVRRRNATAGSSTRLDVVVVDAAQVVRGAMGSTSLQADRWYHAVWWSDGATWRFWLDGVEETLTVFLGANTGAWFGDSELLDSHNVGSMMYNGSRADYWLGSIDEVRIWNRALSADEVLQRWRDDTTINRGR